MSFLEMLIALAIAPTTLGRPFYPWNFPHSIFPPGTNFTVPNSEQQHAWIATTFPKCDVPDATCQVPDARWTKRPECLA